MSAVTPFDGQTVVLAISEELRGLTLANGCSRRRNGAVGAFDCLALGHVAQDGARWMFPGL